MTISININGLSLVHRGSGGVSRATLPDVCRTPPAQAPVPYPNVALSRNLARYPRSVRVDGGNPPAHSASIFASSEGDEPGKGGGVVSGTYAGSAAWLTSSFNVKIEGRGACRLTDKMLHNRGNTVNCGGVVQEPVAAKAASDAKDADAGAALAKASKSAKKKPHKMEIALPFGPYFEDVPGGGLKLRDIFKARAQELGVTYFRLFLQWISGSPSARNDAEIKAVLAAGFGVQITVHGIASPWGQSQGRNGHGVLPNAKAFAKFFAAVIDRYKPLGVKRYSVWNEPNHSGFLRAGAYWSTKHAKARVKMARDLKKAQYNFEVQAEAARQAGDEAKRADFANQANAANEAADKVWTARLSKKDLREIRKEPGQKGKSRTYRLFDIEANARHYRKLYDAAYSAAKRKGVQIWLGELAGSHALHFMDLMLDPKVTGKKGRVRAHALALHPYQYVIAPNKAPTRAPQFLPKLAIAPGDTPEIQAWKNERNKAIDAAKKKKWPKNAKKRRSVIKAAKGNAGIGALATVQGLLRRFASAKKLTKPKGGRIDLYLTEFGYHRERWKIQADRQVPEARRAVWLPLAYQQAYKARVKQNLYYHLTHTWEGHAWDSAICSPDGNTPDASFTALAKWVQNAKKKKRIKEKP